MTLAKLLGYPPRAHGLHGSVQFDWLSRCYIPMRRRDGLLPAGLQIVGHRGHDNEVIEAAIEIERRNAESNNLKEDKDERDGKKNKPDPV